MPRCRAVAAVALSCVVACCRCCSVHERESETERQTTTVEAPSADAATAGVTKFCRVVVLCRVVSLSRRLAVTLSSMRVRVREGSSNDNLGPVEASSADVTRQGGWISLLLSHCWVLSRCRVLSLSLVCVVVVVVCRRQASNEGGKSSVEATRGDATSDNAELRSSRSSFFARLYRHGVGGWLRSSSA